VINLPGPTNRTAVIGSTGSGKTQFSVWLLSSRDFNLRPWIIFDFKGDELLDALGAKPIPVSFFPTEPGLYIMRPLPGEEMAVSRIFYLAWLQENVGLYIDEGYMVPKNCRWFRSCLTMGRSKHIEMIVCSQRPVFMDKYVWTESSYFAIFNLNNQDDRKKVGEYLDGMRPKTLAKYHCLWYDVAQQRGVTLAPVPKASQLIETFKRRLDNTPVKM
jgi:hypothetical protein